MKPGTLAFITGFIFLLTLALPVQLAAQHTRYKLIDIGTLGGPVSYIAGNETGHRQLNNRGIVAGTADISTPDPNVANPDLCLNPDCFLSHAFQWQNGVLTDLGTLAGFDNFSGANVINERGWIAGSSQTGDLDPVTGGLAQHAVLWKDGEIIDLGTLGGNESGGYYINNEGQVVGASAINTTFDPSSQFGATTHPFLWENGVMLDLGTLGGPDAFPWNGCANQRKGLVVGGSNTSSIPDPATGLLPNAPFLWENGTMVNLGTLGGTQGGAACANNRGQVIGGSSLADNPGACSEEGGPGCHAFLWEHGVMQDLGTLGGDNSTPAWINDAGEIVGGADLPGSEVEHAFLWRKGVMTDLGTLGSWSHAEAINSTGQVVGTSRLLDRTEPPFRHAFLSEEGRPMIDLNSLIPANSSLELVEAANINDRGEILGQGVPGRCFVDDCGHLFLLIPCAEGTDDCGDPAGDTTATTERTPVPAINSPTISPQRRLTPSGMAGWRARLTQRYHIHGLRASPRD